MSSAIHSTKSKQKPGTKRPNAGTKGTAERLAVDIARDKKAAPRKLQGDKRSATVKASHEANDVEASSVTGARLRAGARLLTQAISSYAGQTSLRTDRASVRQPHDFQEAYASMINAVPKGIRLDMLKQMHRGLEQAVKAELDVTLGELAANDDDGRVSTADFMARLERQEQEQRESDISSKRLVLGAEMRARLGVTPQALSAALKAKRIFAMQGISGEYMYPAFFADNTYDRPVLEKICKALGDLPAGSKWDFFTSPRTSLGGKTPLEALAKGKVDAVMSAAKAFSEE